MKVQIQQKERELAIEVDGDASGNPKLLEAFRQCRDNRGIIYFPQFGIQIRIIRFGKKTSCTVQGRFDRLSTLSIVGSLPSLPSPW